MGRSGTNGKGRIQARGKFSGGTVYLQTVSWASPVVDGGKLVVVGIKGGSPIVFTWRIPRDIEK